MINAELLAQIERTYQNIQNASTEMHKTAYEPTTRYQQILQAIRERVWFLRAQIPNETFNKGANALGIYEGNRRYLADLMAQVPGVYPLTELVYEPYYIGGPAFTYTFPYSYRDIQDTATGIAPRVFGRIANVPEITMIIEGDKQPPVVFFPANTPIWIKKEHLYDKNRNQPTTRGKEIAWAPSSDIPVPIILD